LADGVFDPLHAGHLGYLRAAQAVDPDGLLIVQVSEQTKRAECVPREQRCQIIDALGYQHAWYPTTLDALKELRPRYYVKGEDWHGGIPEAERAACEELGIQVRFVRSDVRDSSTRRLQAWAARSAVAGEEALARVAAAQVQVPFDADRQGYGTFEARRAVEGRHPDLLSSLCQGKMVLDVGCGPGYLVKMLRERGIEAWGIDPFVPETEWIWQENARDQEDESADIVVCREVLEHLPVGQVGQMLADLFRIAAERVYLTTRFAADPAHPYDVQTEFQADPSHITCLPQSFVRALCVTLGGRRDREWERLLDWQQKGRVLVYEVGR
jgi:cytidyltransferase-like protein